MLSTYLSYDLITRDLLVSLNRTASQGLNAREAAYYKENIGRVASVDEFLDDYRLYSYAMKAYGLEDMTYAKAFMRKVLESDVSDPNSFANLLTDDRYRTFAAAFSFSGSATKSAQTEAQLDEIIGLYSATAANAGAVIQEETRYYNILIDQVTSVDEVLNNDRLRAYVFTAFGIDEKTYSRSTVRQVMSSDLSDPASYYNMTFGAQAANAQAIYEAARDEVAQLDLRDSHIQRIARLDDDIPLYRDGIALLEQEIADLADNPDGLDPEELQTLLDQKQAALDESRTLLAGFEDERVQKQAALDGLDAILVPRDEANARKATLRADMTRQTAILASADKYLVLAAAFNFEADGTAVAGTVQDAAQKTSVNELYTVSNPRVTSAAALMNRDYFESRIGEVATAEELVSDPRLLSYIKVAFGLEKASVVGYTIRNILTSDPDPDNPDSYINRFGGAEKEQYIALRAAFNFQEDGTLAAGDLAQAAAQTEATTRGYMVRYNDKDDEADELAVKRFRSQIGAVRTVTDFVGEASIYQFALKAFGIDAATVSTLTIKNVLKSDLNDPKSYVYTLKDPRLVEFARAFNFGADGNVSTPMLAQSEAEVLAMSRAYVAEKSRFGTQDERTLAEEEAKYYASQMQKIDSVKEFLSDARLVAFVLEANHIDLESVDAEFMARIFTSDLDDPESFVNQQADRSFRKIVASFNFGPDGQVVRQDEAEIQSRRGIYQTIDNYIRQMMEEDAGEDNAGVRLALYFERKASTISSPYDLLADDALFAVFKVLFSLPDEVGSADIDAQAEMIRRHLDLEDLQDPEKVKKMIVKFSVLYDLENGGDSDPALMVLSGSGSAGISADLMMSLSQLRTGGR